MVMWQDTDDKGVTAECHYDKLSGIYTVKVYRGDDYFEDFFGQTFTPTFGMDALDAQQSQQVAEELAKKIDELQIN